MEIVDIVLPVFVVIALGYALGRTGFLSPSARTAFSRVVFYVAAPVLLFRCASMTPLKDAVGPLAVAAMAGVTLVMAFTVYLACGKCAPSRRGVFAQGAHRSNMVFVGMPIVAGAYGEEALGLAALMLGVMVILYNFLAVVLLVLPHRNGGAGDRNTLARTAIDILRNPLIIGSALGILWSALELPLPVFLDRSIELTGRIALPLALLTVGADLDLGRLRSELGPALAAAFIKLIIYPGLMCLVLSVMGLTGMKLAVPVLILATPTAVVSCIMAREMKGDEQLAAAVVMGSTLCSLFTLSGWLLFFGVGG